MSRMLDEKNLFVKNATDYLLGQVTSSTTYGAPFFEIRQAGGRQGGCSSRPHVNKTVKRLKRIDICCGGTGDLHLRGCLLPYFNCKRTIG